MSSGRQFAGVQERALEIVERGHGATSSTRSVTSQSLSPFSAKRLGSLRPGPVAMTMMVGGGLRAPTRIVGVA